MLIVRFLVGAMFMLAIPAAAGDIAGATAERTSPTSITIRWQGSDPVDVYVSDSADAGINTATLVSRADTDGHETIVTGHLGRRYVLLHDQRSKQIRRVAERLLPLEQGSNFRDIGGYATDDGRHVRWGRLYRSGGQPMLTEHDVVQIRSLGLRNLVDLRSNEERRLAPSRIDGVPYNAIGYSMLSMSPSLKNGAGSMQNGSTLYHNFPVSLAPQLRLIFDRLLANDMPLAYNCSAGQDRTGFVTAMIMAALGVPRETITLDYHLSTALRRPEFEMTKIDPALAASDPVAGMFARYQQPSASKPTPLKEADGTAFLDGAYAEIEQRWGSVDAYLEKEAGLDPVERALLRSRYLE
jgi:protein-tyrosine phosphatase